MVLTRPPILLPSLGYTKLLMNFLSVFHYLSSLYEKVMEKALELILLFMILKVIKKKSKVFMIHFNSQRS